MVSPRARRSVVERLRTERGLSQRHACQLLTIQRSSARYIRHTRSDETATVNLVREYAHEQPMHGYRMITAMLKRDGYVINRKRVYRIWRQEGLQLPRRKVTKRRYGDSTADLQRASPYRVKTASSKNIGERICLTMDTLMSKGCSYVLVRTLSLVFISSRSHHSAPVA